nr:collagen alpha-1(I) chain-like [Manis javanica]
MWKSTCPASGMKSWYPHKLYEAEPALPCPALHTPSCGLHGGNGPSSGPSKIPVQAVESPRSGERRAPSSQSWFRTEPRKCASWKPGPGAASPGLSPERSGPAPRPDSGPSRGAEPESRAGGPAQRPGEAGSRTAGGRETAAGRGQRAECTERPCSEQGAARDGGPLWGADPGWPRARSGSRADGGGRASPSPAAPACCVAGHVSGNPGLPAARTCTEEQERGAASAEPGTGLSSFIRPGRGFPSRNPRGPVRAQRGARVPALRRRSTRRPGCAGCRGPASRSFPSLQVRPQRTSRALQPVCFELRLLLFQRPPPPTSPPSDGGGESFHPYFTAEGNRAWGQGGGEGACRCVPSARHCFPTPSIRT